jgi:diphosphomevalonate decarboxylase
LSPDIQEDKLRDHIDFSKYFVQIKSFNSFPTGSGLASSSSGLSALALCFNEIFKNLKLDY